MIPLNRLRSDRWLWAKNTLARHRPAFPERADVGWKPTHQAKRISYGCRAGQVRPTKSPGRRAYSASVQLPPEIMSAGMACRKKRLVAEYEEATTMFAAAVTELQRKTDLAPNRNMIDFSTVQMRRVLNLSRLGSLSNSIQPRTAVECVFQLTWVTGRYTKSGVAGLNTAASHCLQRDETSLPSG
jgi:hypothetical protein